MVFLNKQLVDSCVVSAKLAKVTQSFYEVREEHAPGVVKITSETWTTTRSFIYEAVALF